MTKIFNYKNIQLGLILSVLFYVSSCKKFTEGESNDEELITTVKLNFTQGANTQSFQIRDIDGPGGNDPVTDTIVLPANTTYNVALELMNEAANPVEDITAEVEEENLAHRFYYAISANTPVQIGQLNNDDNGVPLGIESEWTTGSAGTGFVTITLRHYPGTPPDKQVSDPVNSPKSSTDVEVTFPVKIQ